MARAKKLKSIFEELGGEDTLSTVVDRFYQKVLADERIAHFFEGVEMGRQLEKQKKFLAMVFGGPEQFSGKALSVAHHPLVLRGLDDHHVDALLEDLGVAMVELGIRKPLIARILTTANSFRDEVLSREYPQAT